MKRQFEIECLKDVKGELKSKGFVRIRPADIRLAPALQSAFEDLRHLARNLPLDPTATGGFRARRYGKMIRLGWMNSFDAVPAMLDPTTGMDVIEFTQPSEFNSEAQGERRLMPAFTAEMYRNPLVQALVHFDLECVDFAEEDLMGPMQVGLHLIRLQATPSQPAVSSPDLVHRDGEPFTIAHLIERVNVRGGRNYVTTTGWHDHRIHDVPLSDVLDAFTIYDPLETYIVRDDAVAHYVEGVSCGDEGEIGWRTIFLVDFTPLRPALLWKGIPQKKAA